MYVCMYVCMMYVCTYVNNTLGGWGENGRLVSNTLQHKRWPLNVVESSELVHAGKKWCSCGGLSIKI